MLLNAIENSIKDEMEIFHYRPSAVSKNNSDYDRHQGEKVEIGQVLL